MTYLFIKVAIMNNGQSINSKSSSINTYKSLHSNNKSHMDHARDRWRFASKAPLLDSVMFLCNSTTHTEQSNSAVTATSLILDTKCNLNVGSLTATEARHTHCMWTTIITYVTLRCTGNHTRTHEGAKSGSTIVKTATETICHDFSPSMLDGMIRVQCMRDTARYEQIRADVTHNLTYLRLSFVILHNNLRSHIYIIVLWRLQIHPWRLLLIKWNTLSNADMRASMEINNINSHNYNVNSIVSSIYISIKCDNIMKWVFADGIQI